MITAVYYEARILAALKHNSKVIAHITIFCNVGGDNAVPKWEISNKKFRV